jgi:apolipoprotein N-acyltransferase
MARDTVAGDRPRDRVEGTTDTTKAPADPAGTRRARGRARARRANAGRTGRAGSLPGRAARAARYTWAGPVARFCTAGSGRARAMGAVLAGLTMCAAFPPFGLWPLAPVGVALFTLVLRGCSARAAAGLGMLTGLAFFLSVLEGIRMVGPDGWIILGVFEALYFVPLAVTVALAARLPGWPLWSAALWVGEELVRDRVPFGGFPWGRLAFSQTASPLTSYASVAGAPLVTFVTALVGGLLAYALVAALRPAAQRKPRWAVRRPVVVALAGAAAATLAGLAIPAAGTGREVTVAVVQGNVPRLGLDFLGQRQAVLNNHVTQTRRLAAQVAQGRLARPDLVVWPENASDIDPYQDFEASRLIQQAAAEVGVPILVGAVIVRPDGEHLENRGIVWDPRTGPGAYYVKRHPVPFGEYLPFFRDQLRKVITRFERVGEFVPGNGPGLLRVGPVTVGDVICFEVAYDEVVRGVASADVLVVQTNNATYGRTTLPPQQVAMSRLRAVEHGRPVVVAATSGISAIIAADGRMLERSAEFTPDLQVRRIRVGASRTLADHVGATPEWLLALLGAGAAAAAAMPAGVRRRIGRPGAGTARHQGGRGRPAVDDAAARRTEG